MKITRFLFCFALWFPVFARAQDAPEPIHIRFLFLDESSGDYFVKTGDGYKNLGAKPYVVSPSFDFLPGSRIELYKQLPDPETGEPVRKRVVNLTATASPTHALAVIKPTTETTQDSAPAYRAHLYDVTPDKTPARSVRILNLSPAPMAARFGSDQIEISPGAERLVSPTLDKRNRFRVYVASQGAGEWHLIFNSFLSLPANKRMTGIVVYSPSGLRHTYTKDELDMIGPPSPGFFWLYFTESVGSTTTKA